MSRLILLIIGFVAGWFLKDGNWEEWQEKLKSYFEPQDTPRDTPIPLLEEEVAETVVSEADEAFADPLEKLKGIGPASKAKLNDRGIYTFTQIAALSPEALKEIAGARIKAEEVIQNAQELAG